MRSMIKNACFALSVATFGLTGCDAEDGTDDGVAADEDLVDHEFRSGWTPPPDFWNWRSWYPGNGSLAIHEGTDVQAEDCIIWDILGTDVHEGVADPQNPPFLQVIDNEIVGADGGLECVATWEGDLFKLRDASGQVVLTLWGRYMFDVDISEMPPTGSQPFKELQWHHLVAEIYQDRLYLGPHWKPSTELVGTSNTAIRFANPMRKLLLGALIRGECGSNGA